MSDWTVLKLCRATAAFLADRGADAPRLDAELLLGHVLGLDRTQLYMAADRPVDGDERGRYRELVRRRVAGEPVAYIVGRRGFWSFDLRVDPRVLIPRPETERLVELALEFVRGFDHGAWRVIDVGTGSGAVALALARELGESVVLATDISAAALELARDNADELGLRSQVRFVRGDLLRPLADRPASVDIVVSNPPYVGRSDGQPLDPAVPAHEPDLALFAGADGLDAIRELIPQAAAALIPGGLFLCEIGAGQGPTVLELAAAVFARCTIEKDHGGLDRVLRAMKDGELPYRSRLRSDASPAEAAELPSIDIREQ